MIAIDMLGPLRVEIDGRALGVRDFGGIKPKQILEILLVHAGQPVSKDRIADLLWGERLPRDFRRALEAYVSVLRSSMGPAARKLVSTEPGAYRLELGDVSLDTERFDALLRQAALEEGPARGALLERALELVRGELLADEPYATWVVQLRDLYTERSLDAALDAAEIHLAAGAHERALAHAERVVADQPARERAYRIAMAAHVATGEKGLALETYDRCRKALREGFGADPSPETERLYLEILNEEPAQTLAPSLAGERPSLPPTNYARSGSVSIAYKVVGSGPPDIVIIRGFVSHVEACWEWPAYGGFLRRIAALGRLIIFDKRGTGMSDPVTGIPTFEQRTDDLGAVLDAVGSTRAVLLGISEGGPLGIGFATQHPERVQGLVLYGTFPRLLRASDYPHGWPQSFFDAFLESLDRVWATGRGGELANPSAVNDERFSEWVGRYFRLSASPSMARTLMRMNERIDVRHLLPKVVAPTLVLHRRHETWIRPDGARYMAERIPGARLVELDGADHWPWVGETEPLLAEIERFLETLRP